MNPAPMPAITALYAGLAGVLLVVLAALVSLKRRRHGIGLGDGDNRELQRAIRAHGNAVEWLVPAVLLLLVADLNRAGPVLLHLCGLAIVVGRVLHAIGLSRSGGPSFGRMMGSALSWGAVAVLAVWNVWAFVRLLLV
jgi:uncharacterized membrane protein YecN with MAPEG domain